MQPTDFWQDTEPAGTYEKTADTRYRDFYPADLPDGRQLVLPIRPRAEGPEAIASFIANQASFAVLDSLAQALADLLSPDRPDIIVGMPTLGLALAAETARKLGHKRYVPLGTSRKFWYDDGLSVALKSITSPDQAKTLYIDPRLLPLLEKRRIVLIDDAISTGTSMLAGYTLLAKCGAEPALLGAAMLQTERWIGRLEEARQGLSDNVRGVFRSPLLEPAGEGTWKVSSQQSGNRAAR